MTRMELSTQSYQELKAEFVHLFDGFCIRANKLLTDCDCLLYVLEIFMIIASDFFVTLQSCQSAWIIFDNIDYLLSILRYFEQDHDRNVCRHD